MDKLSSFVIKLAHFMKFHLPRFLSPCNALPVNCIFSTYRDLFIKLPYAQNKKSCTVIFDLAI